MNKVLLNDIFSWDIYNWSRSLNFWIEKADIHNKKLECLDIGAGPGGMSLWLALNGNSVLCTDYSDDLLRAKELHKRYNVEHLISYSILDVKNIPFEDKFDIIILKSVLGGIGNNNDVEVALKEIYKALKPGGCLLFIENLKGSEILMKLRRLFSPCGNTWNYLDYQVFIKSLQMFSKLQVMRFGVFGVLGRTPYQQRVLGMVDKYFFEKILHPKKFYIVAGVALK